jgi:hypothetical protein
MQEAEIGRITVPGQLGEKKLSRPHHNRKRWGWWHTSVIPAMAVNIK